MAPRLWSRTCRNDERLLTRSDLPTVPLKNVPSRFAMRNISRVTVALVPSIRSGVTGPRSSPGWKTVDRDHHASFRRPRS